MLDISSHPINLQSQSLAHIPNFQGLRGDQEGKKFFPFLQAARARAKLVCRMDIGDDRDVPWVSWKLPERQPSLGPQLCPHCCPGMPGFTEATSLILQRRAEAACVVPRSLAHSWLHTCVQCIPLSACRGLKLTLSTCSQPAFNPADRIED